MTKIYGVRNSISDDDCIIFYLLYIVLFFTIIFLIYKINYNFNKNDSFDNFNNIKKTSLENTKKISLEDTILELQKKNNELSTMKDTIQNKLTEQSSAIYISQNYNKIDSNSFNNELSFLTKFDNIKFPSIYMDDKKIIKTHDELDNILVEAKGMKNYYKPGDLVTANSTFGVSKHDICYRSNGIPIKPTLEFLSQYPDCMVCSVEDEKKLYNTNEWNQTKTNISKVCLYNPSAETNSGIPNLKQCNQFCNIVNK